MDAPGNSLVNAPGTAPATAPKTVFKQKVFSGVQPTGNLHLGNYLGAVTKFVDLQDRYDCIYCVVDLHAITVWQDPPELTRAIREVTAAFIAAGLGPERAAGFYHNPVARESELAWGVQLRAPARVVDPRAASHGENRPE